MKIKFDGNQDFQLDAIRAVVVTFYVIVIAPLPLLCAGLPTAHFDRPQVSFVAVRAEHPPRKTWQACPTVIVLLHCAGMAMADAKSGKKQAG